MIRTTYAARFTLSRGRARTLGATQKMSGLVNSARRAVGRLLDRRVPRISRRRGPTSTWDSRKGAHLSRLFGSRLADTANCASP
jgi:hypothetical protein